MEVEGEFRRDGKKTKPGGMFQRMQTGRGQQDAEREKRRKREKE